MKFNKNDAPILIVLGQSNAHAHGTRLPEAEIIRTPLKNVHGLSREYNQAYGLDDVTWSGFTTGGMNLGETQDDTCCLANVFAAKWQAAIDGGEELPDLYVIQISVGAQGVAQFEIHGWNMWYALREPILKPGPLGECNISLYPLATEILSLATMNLIAAGKSPRVIGLHWNQWETEVDTGSKALNDAKANYENLFWGLFTALGSDKSGKNVPLYLYRPLSECYNPRNTERMIDTIEGFRQVYADCRILDLRESPLYNDTPKTHGIFADDGVHYTPEANRFFADCQWRDIFE
ncbi:MAG: hypothetical protein E7632_02145 [Ruminococcaceae bacterium]|nr:hypothetical protein [Oscillospiraceae bacterium]